MVQSVEQITDDQLDQIVELANRQWQQAPGKLPTDPARLTPLMACHIIRAFLKIIQEPRQIEEQNQL
jgi:hypothetical protein